MNKRPPVDLKAITSEVAEPMAEGVQRAAEPAPLARKLPKSHTELPAVRTEALVPLSFKVAPAFRKRFRDRAHHAELKKVELLAEALEAWEEKHGFKS
jgi:hypothetical protein